MATRWGILGTGAIALDFTICLFSQADEEHKIVAVAARNKERAEEFAAEFDIPRVHATYQELINDSEVDVIYISTIHINHVELSLACINAGKNIVCEKPMSLSLEGCQKVLAAAKEKNVLFVEGFWTRFFPVTQFMKDHASSGALGEVRHIQANFAVPISHVDRVKKRELGGGGLMDIGCYTVQWANFFFKGRPESITAHGPLNEDGCDKSCVIVLRYSSNKIATLVYDTETSGGANSLIVRGTKGNLVIPDKCWCPDRVMMQDGQVKFFQLPSVEKQESMNFLNSQGFCYEIQGVRECLLKGLKESPNITHEDSETIMYILTEVQKQLGVKYDFP